MYYFLQFRPDKKEAWRLYSEEQLRDSSQLPGPPAFQTVLRIDQDPDAVLETDQNPLDVVKYMGPFYLDFDCEDDIDKVLDDVREVIQYLTTKLDIPEEFIHCWLSGGKGVHIIVPEEVFGLKAATKVLPMIYREIVETIYRDTKAETLDRSVYSCGRGRMWRCEGVARPGSGTFKVATTVSEIMEMDSETYKLIVAQPRPPMVMKAPAKSVTFMKAEALLKAARVGAQRKVRAMKEATVIPVEVFKEWVGIPGCVERLITEGDCDQSNWNQAAMQLATYIAARYEQSEEQEYLDELVKPFAKDVQSNSRPSETERLKHVKEQIVRARRGSIKFSVGAFIATIGRPCGNCPVCRSDIANGESEQDEEMATMHADTKIKWDSRGYHLVGENGLRQLTTFTFWPDTEVTELIPATLANGMPGWKESPRQELRGYMFDDEGRRIDDVKIPERAWGSKRELINAFKGQGDALVYCGDAETQRLLKTILTFARAKSENKELDKMTRTNVCGIVFQRTEKATIPHYVEADASITSTGRSPYRFHGNARQSPALLNVPNPFVDDVELADAIRALCKINEPVQVALAMGWFVACHFREHIQYEEPQFPLLNISGNSEAGKTSMGVLMAMLNGIDYTRAEYLNVEVGSLYPLVKYVSSSTTVPRLVEEVNPMQLGTKYQAIVGILKASWNKAPIPRGRIIDKDLSISEDRVSAPLVYTSEQSSIVPSLRTRSVEVKLSSKSLLNPLYVRSYEKATHNRTALLRLARVLVTVAMNTSPKALLKIFHSKKELIEKSISARPRWGFQTSLTGLHMLIMTMEEFKVGGVEAVRELEGELIQYLSGRVAQAERGKSASEVDRVLQMMNVIAEENENTNIHLKASQHYWRNGDHIYMVLQSCLPQYLRHMRSVGERPVISDYHQLRSLLEGEVYFERTESHPYRPGTEVFVIDAEKLAARGTVMNNFNESEPDEQ